MKMFRNAKVTTKEFKIRHFEYERMYLPLYKVADTPFHIRGEEMTLFATNELEPRR